MKIIDLERKGNVIRFYLGEKTEKWGWTNPDYKDSKGNTPDWLTPSDTFYGDDWNDTPYNCNAGKVYDEFIKDAADCFVPFDGLVFEPCDTPDCNCRYSRADMVKNKVPALVIVPPEAARGRIIHYFEDALGMRESIKIYLGDDLNDYVIMLGEDE